MTPAHDELKGDAAAYVLGSLEPGERAAFEAHLAGCAECTEDVRSLRAVTGALAQAAPPRTPRPELRARVLGASPVPVHSRQAPRSTARTLRWLPLAASLLLTVAVGMYAFGLRIRLADLEARLERAILTAGAADQQVAAARRIALDAQAAMAVLAAPDVARIDLTGQPAAPQAQARALWSRDRGMVFTVTSLPPAPEGQVYQVWVVTADAPISAGLLALDPTGGASTYFNTPPDIAPPVAVAVTLEPAGGVPAPTGARYLIGTPAPL